jgi:hypothetical protein
VDALIVVGDPVADYIESLPIHDGIDRIGSGYNGTLDE